MKFTYENTHYEKRNIIIDEGVFSFITDKRVFYLKQVNINMYIHYITKSTNYRILNTHDMTLK